MLYKHLPQQRKLSAESAQKAVDLLSMNANKQLVQSSLAAETGKVILLRDLTNLMAHSKEPVSRNSLEAFVSLLQEKYREFST